MRRAGPSGTGHLDTSSQEIAIAERLHHPGAPVAALNPRVPPLARQAAQRLLTEHERTPGLGAADRALLLHVLATASTVVDQHGDEQVLHGEPHPGNVLLTRHGLLFIDGETCCRGPLEFDLAHAPDGVGEAYPGVDVGLLQECRSLVLAMVTTWRYDAADQLTGGPGLGQEWLARLRAELENG